MPGADDDGEHAQVYIHAKLLSIDDRRLFIGSANLNNRSMTLDSELGVGWAADHAESELGRAIAGLRLRLLAEHVGTTPDHPELRSPLGLVARLDAMASSGTTRLRRHDLDAPEPNLLMKLGQKIAGAYADPPHCPESRESPLLFDGPAPVHPR